MLLLMVLAATVAQGDATDVRPGDELDVACPAGVRSMVYMPEPGIFNVAPGGAERLGIKVESLARGVFSVTPSASDQKTRLSFRGKGGVLTIRVSSSWPGETAREFRYRWAKPGMSSSPATPVPTAILPAPVTPAPTSVPVPTPTPTPHLVSPPATASTTAPTAPPATPTTNGPARHTDDLELKELALAGRPVRLNEVQGMPGQKRMILESAQEGPEHVWFRFRLEGGHELQVKQIDGPEGPVTAYMSDVEKNDLTIVAQLPKSLWKRKGGMKITVSSGLSYKFRLRNAGLLRVLGDVTDVVNPF
jgi:hypothetical protein